MFLPTVGKSLVVAVMVLAAPPKNEDAKGETGYIGVALKDNGNGGLTVNEVRDESPAMKAGLIDGDRIVKINGEAVGTLQAFVQKIRDTKPGAEVKLLVARDSEEKEIKVKVGKFPKEDK